MSQHFYGLIYFWYTFSFVKERQLRSSDAVASIDGRDPFNQNSNRSDREKRTSSKVGPVFSKLFRLDRTDPLSFGPKFPEILVEWIAPDVLWLVMALPWESNSEEILSKNKSVYENAVTGI